MAWPRQPYGAGAPVPLDPPRKSGREHQVWQTWLGFTVIPAEAYQLGYRGGGMLDAISAPLFVVGLGYAVAHWKRASEGFLLYWWGVTALTGGVMTNNPPAFVRMVGLIPAVAILAALPLRGLLLGWPPPDLPRGQSWPQGRDLLQHSPIVNRSMHGGRRVGAIFVAILLLLATWDNWRTYFVEHANMVADETSELVHFVRRVPVESPVYLLGAEFFLRFTRNVDCEQFAFDFPGRQLIDVPEPAQMFPLRETAGAPTYLVLGPTQTTLAGYIRHLYPHTEVRDVVHPTGRLLFRTLRITAGDIQGQSLAAAGTQGLLARYEGEGGAVLQRIDPQLNSFAFETLYIAGHRLPVQMPFVATWSGELRISTPGTYGFEVIGSGPYAVDLKGERLCAEDIVKPDEPKTCTATRQLAPGLYPIRARWDTTAGKSNPRRIFQIYWTPPGGERVLIPPDCFVPEET